VAFDESSLADASVADEDELECGHVGFTGHLEGELLTVRCSEYERVPGQHVAKG
jgi:hypothetical protein